MNNSENDVALAVIKQMFEEVNAPHKSSNEEVLIKLSAMELDIAGGKGWIKGGVSLASMLLFVFSCMALYVFEKVESHGVKIAKHETRISVVESRLNLLTRVKYKK